MDIDNRDRPSGSLPQRFISKLRSMRDDIDEMIDYLQRVDGGPQADNTTRNVDHRYNDKQTISQHMIPYIRMHGPQSRRQMLAELRSGGRPLPEDTSRALGIIKTAMSQSINAGKIVRVDSEVYDVAEKYSQADRERLAALWDTD